MPKIDLNLEVLEKRLLEQFKKLSYIPTDAYDKLVNMAIDAVKEQVPKEETERRGWLKKKW